jgi:NTE family protein
VGIAWLVGMLQGLADEGLVLVGNGESDDQPDAIVGTSAGSIVGALMTTHSLDDMEELSLSADSAAISMETVPLLDLGAMIECFDVWQKLPDTTPATLAKVGAYALATNTISEDRWVASMTDVIGSDWPSDRFRCTAVNAETGDFVAWGAESGVGIDRALASSCSVPCIFPSVTINGSRYTDGGVRSGTSIDLLDGFDRVLTLAPIGSWDADSLDAPAALAAKNEGAQVEASGGKVITVFTDDATNQATLLTPLGRMDPDVRAAALSNGRRQGRELAPQLKGWW